MPEKDNTGMGERIQSMVEDAVASMNFEQLNRNITGSIQSALKNEYTDATGNRTKRQQGSECEVSLWHREDGRTGSDQIC